MNVCICSELCLLHILLRLDDDIVLRLIDSDLVRHESLCAVSACGIVVEHDVNLDSQAALAEEHVADSGLDEVALWVTGCNHVTISELHALCALTTDLARHHNGATEGTTLHDEADHTIAGTAYSSTDPGGKLNLFCTTAVSSRMRRPFSPSTFWVRVARMMISWRAGVWRTSTPE